MPLRSLPLVDPGKVAVIQGAVWNELVALLEKLRPLAEIESQSLQITRGDTRTKIEVRTKPGTDVATMGEVTVGLCDEAGNTVVRTFLGR